MKAVSIILPIYKVERYVAKCLESIIAQLFDNFELIVVDDCGMDRSLEICKEMLCESQIDYHIIQNPLNCGLSLSRNIGVKKSSGQFIMFIDSDDWVDPLLIRTLYDAATQNDADITACRATRFWEDSTTFSEIPNLAQGIYSANEYLDLYFNGCVNSEAWGRLYKRSLFDSVEFPTKVNNEDLLTLPFLIKRSAKIVQLEAPLYFYVQRESKGSITDSKPTNPEGFLAKLSSFKSFDTQSPRTKANSLLFAYRHSSAIAIACVFHSKNFSEVEGDLKGVSRFIDKADFLALLSGLRATTLSMILMLKYSPFLFYKLHKIAWQLKGIR